MSIESSFEISPEDDDPNINWEYIIHKTLSLSMWLFAGSFTFLFLIYYVGSDKAAITTGASLGFYLLAMCGESVLGAAFNDDNNPAGMSKLGKLLSRFQVPKAPTAK